MYRVRALPALWAAAAARSRGQPIRQAGHSKWANIQHVKKAKDIKRAKEFAKVSREIMSAVKQGGDDPSGNSRLASALARGRNVNMPKETIERSLKAGMSSGDDLETITYEGHGPGGVAYIVEALTDNKNRTVAQVRHLFKEAGGALGAAGSASWMFDRMAEVAVVAPGGGAGADEVLEALLEAEVDAEVEEVALAEDAEADAPTIKVICEHRAVGDAQRAVAEVGCRAVSVLPFMRPQTLTATEGEVREATLAFLDEIEGHDDVQQVWCSADAAHEPDAEEEPA